MADTLKEDATAIEAQTRVDCCSLRYVDSPQSADYIGQVGGQQRTLIVGRFRGRADLGQFAFEPSYDRPPFVETEVRLPKCDNLGYSGR